MLDDEERTSISNVRRLYSTNAASDCCYTVGDNGESFFLPHMGLSRLSHQGGISVVSGGGRVRGEDLNLSAILCTLCQ